MRKLYLELLKSKYNGDMIAMIKGTYFPSIELYN